jgi:hypothetical protein
VALEVEILNKRKVQILLKMKVKIPEKSLLKDKIINFIYVRLAIAMAPLAAGSCAETAASAPSTTTTNRATNANARSLSVAATAGGTAHARAPPPAGTTANAW